MIEKYKSIWYLFITTVLLAVMVAAIIFSLAFGKEAGTAIGFIDPTVTPTLTKLPTSTPTFTQTPTITPSPTATLIPPTKTMTPYLPTSTITPTLTPSPTNVPIPTATPLAFAKSAEEETLIIIFPFYTAEGIRDDLPHRIIHDALEERAIELPIENFRAEIYPESLVINDLEEVKEIGNLYDASIIIWGEQTGIKVQVNLYNLMREDDEVYFQNVALQETIRTQANASNEVYSQYILEELPTQVNFYILLSLAQEKGFQNNFEESLTMLGGAINNLGEASVPIGDLGDAYNYLAWLLSHIELTGSDLTAESYNKAIELFSEAIALNPQASAYSDRGLVFSLIDETEAAFADFNVAIELEPENANLYFNRAKIHRTQGNYTAALVDYTKAIEIQPDNEFFYFNRGRIFQDLRQYEAALVDYEKAVELNSQVAYIYLNLGLVNHSLSQYETALINFREAIDLDPNYAYAYHSRGWTYYFLDEYENAISDLSQAIEIDSNYSHAYYRRGRIYY